MGSKNSTVTNTDADNDSTVVVGCCTKINKATVRIRQKLTCCTSGSSGTTTTVTVVGDSNSVNVGQSQP